MSKLFYKLGLEELAEEPSSLATGETVQAVELETNQLQNELEASVQQADVLASDSESLQEVKSALESALKGTGMNRDAVLFAQHTLKMVDKRWSGDYPTVSTEGSDDQLIASMEDGVGQRLKDMGKALLEMLKKIWAKLKEWGGKILQLLGLKKKQLQDIKKEAQLIKEERWEEVGGYSHHVKQYSDGSETRLVSKTITREDYVAPVPAFAGTHHEDKPAPWRGKAATPQSEQPAAKSKGIDWSRTPGAVPRAAVPHIPVGEFNPPINQEMYRLLSEGSTQVLPVTSQGFSKQLRVLAEGVDACRVYSWTMEDILNYAKGSNGIIVDDTFRVFHDHLVGRFVKMFHKRIDPKIAAGYDYTTTTAVLPGAHGFVMDENIAVTFVTAAMPDVAFVRFTNTRLDLEYAANEIGWLTPDDVITVQGRLDHFIDYLTQWSQTTEKDVNKWGSEIVQIFSRPQRMASALAAGKLDHMIERCGAAHGRLMQGFMTYARNYISALTRHLELSLDYWKHNHLVNMSKT